jgi:hypothetical protein
MTAIAAKTSRRAAKRAARSASRSCGPVKAATVAAAVRTLQPHWRRTKARRIRRITNISKTTGGNQDGNLALRRLCYGSDTTPDM